MSERTDDLITDIIAAAQGITTAYEWGTGTEGDRRDLKRYREELTGIIGALEASIAALREAAAWHPASEKPKVRKKYLVITNPNHPEPSNGNFEYYVFTWFGVWGFDNVMFWRELPTPLEVE